MITDVQRLEEIRQEALSYFITFDDICRHSLNCFKVRLWSDPVKYKQYKPVDHLEESLSTLIRLKEVDNYGTAMGN